MKIIRNTMPIADIYNLMKTNELQVNRQYQRSQGLWPNNARAYFIDSILNEFPFPKVVLRQTIDLKSKVSIREIIDGQQRLTTICDFIDNKLILTSVSENYQGLKFEDLSDELRSIFLGYEISVDNIIAATTEEILEIFRRINSYTLPLNPPEKRHATYQGEFKWFIAGLTEIITPFLSTNDILTLRRISRLEDADLLTECCQLVIHGIQARSDKKLDDIYKEFDKMFLEKDRVRSIIIDTFQFLKNDMFRIFIECKVQPYQFYSLMSALIFNKYGLVNSREFTDSSPIGKFVENLDGAIYRVIELLSKAESKESDGGTDDLFIEASSTTTHGLKNRLTRFKFLVEALRVN
nr:DUF262 domain-containing protein [uncultured Neisseria sp.]